MDTNMAVVLNTSIVLTRAVRILKVFTFDKKTMIVKSGVKCFLYLSATRMMICGEITVSRGGSAMCRVERQGALSR